jgi:uncharacterized protein (DUF1778 family)
MSMARIQRLQIPVTDEENRLFQRAAQKEGVPAAEWARNRLRRDAERILAQNENLSPADAVRALSKLNAPIADWRTLKKEILQGRYS